MKELKIHVNSFMHFDTHVPKCLKPAINVNNVSNRAKHFYLHICILTHLYILFCNF